MRKRLTAVSVARLKPPAKGQTLVTDLGYPGLGVRLSYAGTRSFVFHYRFNGRWRRLLLGTWPAMQLAEARDAWREARQAVAKGTDPAEVRRQEAADNFATVAEQWLKRDQAHNRTQHAVKRLLDVDVLPKWRHRRIAEIGRRDVLDLIDRICGSRIAGHGTARPCASTPLVPVGGRQGHHCHQPDAGPAEDRE